jgi:hypothetical protein
MPQRLTLFSGVSLHHKGLAHSPLRDSSRRKQPLQAWGMHPQPNWRLPRTTQYCQTTSSKFIKYTNQGLGFQGNPRHKPLEQMRGESKSLWWGCRSRHPPSIPQRSTTLGRWGRRSCKLGGSNNGGFSCLARAALEEEGGINTLPPIWPLADSTAPAKARLNTS